MEKNRKENICGEQPWRKHMMRWHHFHSYLFIDILLCCASEKLVLWNNWSPELLCYSQLPSCLEPVFTHACLLLANKFMNSKEKYDISFQTAKLNYEANIWGIFPESDQFFMRISRSAGCQGRLFRNSVRNPKAHWTLGATGWNKSQKDQPCWRWYFQNIRIIFVLDDQNNGFVEGQKICQGLRTPILTVHCLQVEK